MSLCNIHIPENNTHSKLKNECLNLKIISHAIAANLKNGSTKKYRAKSPHKDARGDNISPRSL